MNEKEVVYKHMEKWCSKRTFTILMFTVVLIGIAWASVAGWKAGNHLSDRHFYGVVYFSGLMICITMLSFVIDNLIKLYK